jgi:hypothetical protein
MNIGNWRGLTLTGVVDFLDIEQLARRSMGHGEF